MHLKFVSGLFLLGICLLSGMVLNAQITTPAPSPSSTIKQAVGVSEITIEYSRPSKKDRVIFGDLVPYNQLWRTGANAATKITFSDDVKISGNAVPKGTYAIYTIPTPTDWTVILYKNTTLGGNLTLSEVKDSEVAAKFMAKSYQFTEIMMETFTFDIGDLTSNSANIAMLWDKTVVAFQVDLNTDEKVMADIKAKMAGPSGNDYAAAARYYHDSGKDIQQAKTWMKKSIEMNGERFWTLRQLSLIEAKSGDYISAVATAKRSLALAEEAKNADYIKMNNDSIKEWTKK